MNNRNRRINRASYYNEAKRIWEHYWYEKVPCGYKIHHINRDYTSNHVSNLALVTHSSHAKIHDLGRTVSGG